MLIRFHDIFFHAGFRRYAADTLRCWLRLALMALAGDIFDAVSASAMMLRATLSPPC